MPQKREARREARLVREPASMSPLLALLPLSAGLLAGNAPLLAQPALPRAALAAPRLAAPYMGLTDKV